MDNNFSDNTVKMSNGYVLPMVRTKLDVERPLYSEKPIESAQDLVDLLGNYMADLAYETAAVVCFDADRCPICVGLVGIGDHSEAPMPVRSVLQLALLSNAMSVAVVHNHPSVSRHRKSAGASQKDVEAIDVVMKGCMLMGMYFYDSIILAHDCINGEMVPTYYSMREKEPGRWKKNNPDKYTKGLIKSTYRSERFLPWDDYEDASKYWGTDVTKLEYGPQFVASSPKELQYAIELVNAGLFDNEKKAYLEQEKLNKAKELKIIAQGTKKATERIVKLKEEYAEICSALEKIENSGANKNQKENEELSKE